LGVDGSHQCFRCVLLDRRARRVAEPTVELDCAADTADGRLAYAVAEGLDLVCPPI
jgi:hypothetical protein